MTDEHNTQKPDQRTLIPPPDDFASVVPDTPRYPVLTLDEQEYRKFVADAHLTPEEEQQLIAAYWQIVVAWVDFGWGINPVQQVMDAERLDHDSGVVLDSLNNSHNNNTALAVRSIEPVAGGSDS